MATLCACTGRQWALVMAPLVGGALFGIAAQGVGCLHKEWTAAPKETLGLASCDLLTARVAHTGLDKLHEEYWALGLRVARGCDFALSLCVLSRASVL